MATCSCAGTARQLAGRERTGPPSNFYLSIFGFVCQRKKEALNVRSAASGLSALVCFEDQSPIQKQDDDNDVVKSKGNIDRGLSQASVYLTSQS